MLTYSVVGLGNLGEKISSNLLKQGFEVTEVKKAMKDIKQPHPLTGEAV